MDKEQLLKIILGISTCSERVGTFNLALERARFICGNIGEKHQLTKAEFYFRQDTLEKCMNGNVPSQKEEIGELFVSLFLYLNCLEQLGLLFLSKKEKDENGIKESLEYACNNGMLNFNGVKEEIKVLTRLRHSLAHNYGLVSIPKWKQTTYYKYLLSFEEAGNKIIDMPKNNWSGDYTQKNDDLSVIIYVFPLINKIEEIIESIKSNFLNGTLSCSISKEELEARFTILY